MAVMFLMEICVLTVHDKRHPTLSFSVRSAVAKKRREERRMKSTGLLLGYFLMKVLVCDAEGEPGKNLDGLVTASGSNDSRDGGNGLSETPHTEDRCRGYYDVMGQWDPPFVCRTGSYLYCCGTCGFRFCCEFKNSRLDQTTCKNYDTPPWSMTGRPPPKMMDQHDPTKDKTNLIVYIICGVVAIMALVGIFTKLGLEKAHRPHRENMSRALAQVMRQTAPGEHVEREESLAVHGQHYENMQARATGNNLPEKANENFYTNRRHLADLAAKGTLPMHSVSLEQEPTNPYSPELPCQKQNGHKSKSTKVHSSHPLAFGSNTIANPGMLKNWEVTETLGRRQTHGPRKHSATVEQVNELTSAHSQHYLPPHPYFVTNSKTEVTV
ncbi:protein shisa-9B isoform X2 [Chanodichthys erythropterus]|uniref:protein shisa-9B isoform X2 n=1 Tax=Megalobrama amblycephala TaxID=75352 RepID=UPI0020143628|nr:protein shisa-9B isoform X2 [Megalobrama amblycephala]XP_051744790.1 protein shisa-9B isoform X2 [Ctenopharyngodon idella]